MSHYVLAAGPTVCLASSKVAAIARRLNSPRALGSPVLAIEFAFSRVVASLCEISRVCYFQNDLITRLKACGVLFWLLDLPCAY